MRPEFRTESIITASGPIRYLIRCRRAKFEDRGHSDTQLIERLSKRQGLDPGKVFHLGTDKTANLVHIVFDYGNLDHHHRCTIRAFKGVSLKEVQFPGAMTDYLHRYVDDWIDEVETNKNRFPVQTEVLPPGHPNHASHPDHPRNRTPGILVQGISSDQATRAAMNSPADGVIDVAASPAAQSPDQLGVSTVAEGLY
ncbi:hypothetical protein QBC46DRAFT_67752 [Diplogelasinospora grovesii]|uniref:Uncharacterized protein n=1 Tax=Diplogelasinospora grovesii TaxID=303347 RepID=A0AAN6MWR6_9PEZI|nr:hypothetical protein QBC46DRAFT_67752 [Diplogelasinospora grovesii]